MWEKVQGIRSINSRYKIDRGRLRIIWEMEKPKNLTCTTDGHALRWGNDGGSGVQGSWELRGEKNGTTVIA